jgi:hypothetical protein
MSKFKVGDKVRFVDTDCGPNWEARRNERTIGTVIQVQVNAEYHRADVDWHDGRGTRSGRGSSGSEQLEHVYRVGETYKWTSPFIGDWFTIQLTNRIENDVRQFRGTVVDRGTFYADNVRNLPVGGTYVDTENLSEITTKEEITAVNETKVPSFLVHFDEAAPTVTYPFVAQGRYVRNADSEEVFYVSAPNTTTDQDEELAQFFVDAINEKIERDK